jgi:SAM-dependent methyltransferase
MKEEQQGAPGSSALAATLPAPATHLEQVQEQLTAQAPTFTDPNYAFADPEVLEWMIGNIPVGRRDLVLDLAGGTGEVGRALAPAAKSVVVLDATPKMLGVGRQRALARRRMNMVFQRGDAAATPFVDDTFDLVVSRFALHHMLNPAAVLAETARVCREGGLVAVMDLLVADPAYGDRYNHFERRRDPSHVRALGEDELISLMQGAGFELEEFLKRDRELDLSRWLEQAQASDRARAEVRDALVGELDGGPVTGMRPSIVEGKLHYTQRWGLAVARPSNEPACS